MKEIIVRTQAELDNLPKDFAEKTLIVLDSPADIWLKIVEAWGNTHVEAWDNTHVVARDNTHVVARDNTHVVARDNTHVVARGNTHVEARDNTHVVARDNTHVEAWDTVAVHALSDLSTILLFGFATCFVKAKCKPVSKSPNATIITPVQPVGIDGWLLDHGIEPTQSVILFKRVSKDFKTQEGTKNETLWMPGTKVSHPDWTPSNQECGPGKFHACPTTQLCNEFRSTKNDRYVAIQISKNELFVWDGTRQFPHKIAFREGVVLYECNYKGDKLPTQPNDP